MRYNLIILSIAKNIKKSNNHIEIDINKYSTSIFYYNMIFGHSQ